MSGINLVFYAHGVGDSVADSSWEKALQRWISENLWMPHMDSEASGVEVEMLYYEDYLDNSLVNQAAQLALRLALLKYGAGDLGSKIGSYIADAPDYYFNPSTKRIVDEYISEQLFFTIKKYGATNIRSLTLIGHSLGGVVMAKQVVDMLYTAPSSRVPVALVELLSPLHSAVPPIKWASRKQGIKGKEVDFERYQRLALQKLVTMYNVYSTKDPIGGKADVEGVRDIKVGSLHTSVRPALTSMMKQIVV